MVGVCHATDDTPAHACAEIGYGFFCPEVIGDFPEGEARQFFTDQALPRAGHEVELSEDDWTKVWEVWGNVRMWHSHMLAVLLHAVLLLFACEKLV